MTPQEAYCKAYILGLRIPELEPIISKDACYSYCYAINIIKGRFILGKSVISQDAEYSYLYAKYVIKGRFILGEPAISKNAEYSYRYAIDVIKGRLPDFMHNAVLFSNDESAKNYVKLIQ